MGAKVRETMLRREAQAITVPSGGDKGLSSCRTFFPNSNKYIHQPSSEAMQSNTVDERAQSKEKKKRDFCDRKIRAQKDSLFSEFDSQFRSPRHIKRQGASSRQALTLYFISCWIWTLANRADSTLLSYFFHSALASHRLSALTLCQYYGY